jgi:hypothetical protein
LDFTDNGQTTNGLSHSFIIIIMIENKKIALFFSPAHAFFGTWSKMFVFFAHMQISLPLAYYSQMRAPLFPPVPIYRSEHPSRASETCRGSDLSFIEKNHHQHSIYYIKHEIRYIVSISFHSVFPPRFSNSKQAKALFICSN